MEARKRRVTDFIYRRVRDDPVVALPTKPSTAAVLNAPPKRRASVDTNGIPHIRTTTPGEEVSDFAKLRAAQKPEAEGAEETNKNGLSEPSTSRSTTTAVPSSTPSKAKPDLESRRFHLAHDLSALSRVHGSGRVSKRANKFKPPLPTFIEAMEKAIANGNGSMQIRAPIDRVAGNPQDPSHDADTPMPAVSETVPTFFKPDAYAKKVGTSIKDHPSTWDITSDQLADELTALALEIEPGSDHGEAREQKVAPVPEAATAQPDMHIPDDDFVYETYIKIDSKILGHGGADTLIDLDANVGVLVINEEDEELWEEYMQSDDEEDWDEEDSNGTVYMAYSKIVLTTIQLKKILLTTIPKTKWVPTTNTTKGRTIIGKADLAMSNGMRTMNTVETALTCASSPLRNPKCDPESRSDRAIMSTSSPGVPR